MFDDRAKGRRRSAARETIKRRRKKRNRERGGGRRLTCLHSSLNVSVPDVPAGGRAFVARMPLTAGLEVSATYNLAVERVEGNRPAIPGGMTTIMAAFGVVVGHRRRPSKDLAHGYRERGEGGQRGRDCVTKVEEQGQRVPELAQLLVIGEEKLASVGGIMVGRHPNMERHPLPLPDHAVAGMSIVLDDSVVDIFTKEDVVLFCSIVKSSGEGARQEAGVFLEPDDEAGWIFGSKAASSILSTKVSLPGKMEIWTASIMDKKTYGARGYASLWPPLGTLMPPRMGARPGCWRRLWLRSSAIVISMLACLVINIVEAIV